MKAETIKDIREEINKLKKLRSDIYDYDYDDTALWHIDEAINHLKKATL